MRLITGGAGDYRRVVAAALNGGPEIVQMHFMLPSEEAMRSGVVTERMWYGWAGQLLDTLRKKSDSDEVYWCIEERTGYMAEGQEGRLVLIVWAMAEPTAAGAREELGRGLGEALRLGVR